MSAPLALTPRAALREAFAFAIPKTVVRGCVEPSKSADALFERARIHGLDSIDRRHRSGHLARVIGEVAESVAEIILDEQDYNLLWQITTPASTASTCSSSHQTTASWPSRSKERCSPARFHASPSRLRQMSRAWLNDPANPAMAEWSLQAEDLYAGIMLVDLATPRYRLALSGDFAHYTPVAALADLAFLRGLLSG